MSAVRSGKQFSGSPALPRGLLRPGQRGPFVSAQKSGRPRFRSVRNQSHIPKDTQHALETEAAEPRWAERPASGASADKLLRPQKDAGAGGGCGDSGEPGPDRQSGEGCAGSGKRRGHLYAAGSLAHTTHEQPGPGSLPDPEKGRSDLRYLSPKKPKSLPGGLFVKHCSILS